MPNTMSSSKQMALTYRDTQVRLDYLVIIPII
jgi:hypothetical protein